MTTINNLSIEQMCEIVNSVPVWNRSENGKQIEYSPTHHNLHPHAQIKWVWNDGSITAICLIEQNQPEYWIDLTDLRTAIAEHDSREFKVGDLVVCTDDFEGRRDLTENDIARAITVKKITAFIDDWGLVLNDGEHWVDTYRFRHATPSEIKAGHRLEAERHG